MKVLFLDFDGVLNDFYPNTERHLAPNFKEEWEIQKKVNNFIYDTLLKYSFDESFDNPPNFCSLSDLDSDKIQYLNKVVKETDCKIVFSTAWRSVGVENLALLLAIRGFNYPEHCIGKTGRVSGVIEYKGVPTEIHSCRGLEIKQWLENRDDIESFAILDDEGFDVKEFYKDEFIQVKGLTDSDACAIINILNGDESSVESEQTLKEESKQKFGELCYDTVMNHAISEDELYEMIPYLATYMEIRRSVNTFKKEMSHSLYRY